MRPASRARLLAGAFLLCALPLAAERLQLAAERADGACPAGRDVLGIVGPTAIDSGVPAGGCLLVFPLPDFSDASLDAAAARLARPRGFAAVVIETGSAAAAEDPDRLRFAFQKLASAARAGSPSASVAFDLTSGLAPGERRLLGDGELAPYADALVVRPERGRVGAAEIPAAWILLSPAEAESAADAALRALAPPDLETSSIRLIGVSAAARPLSEADAEGLVRLQRYWTADVSRDPTPTRGTRADGTTFPVARFYDAKAFTPILLLPRDPAGTVSIELAGGPFEKASAENLLSGGKREFDLRRASALRLDLSAGPLAVVLRPAARAGGETRTTIDVGAERGLTAEEIVARERAWDTAQREKTHSFIADMNASLRFRVADVNETFDLTIRGPFFFRRGEPPDWAWEEFYLNGVKWKGKTLPKLPILQPEKVTTLPLDIRLTEDYRYELHGQSTVGGRRAYQITYSPKSSVGERPIYRGTVWIDTQTFALLRRESIQLNLKGETLSNVQNEYYRPVPGRPDVILPLEIRGQQVFSTAGRTTAIERNVTIRSVELNARDFETRRAALHASPTQMIRDTERGMRYLVPDAEHPGERVVEEHISKKSTFGLLGGFYDDALDYPIPLLGVQHFNFDLFGKGKQVSIFFGGALLTANYTDPALFGTRWDFGVDLFGVAVPFGDVSYREGREVSSEKIKHLPAVLQFNLGRPLGPYLKTSLGVFTKWDNYQRDELTGPDFVTPNDTFTDGAELKLVGNFSGYNATLAGGYYRRRQWDPWGDPATSEFDPRQKDYFKYSLRLSKNQYFPGFRKLNVSLAYLGGSDLDRFSRYEFGSFSGQPIRGFKNGSLRTETAFAAGVSYGINIEDIIRFEAFYDQALLRDRRSGFDNTYFSGAGLLASFNGPWANSLIRAEVGVPVVSHGVKGFVINAVLLKLF